MHCHLKIPIKNEKERDVAHLKYWITQAADKTNKASPALWNRKETLFEHKQMNLTGLFLACF